MEAEVTKFSGTFGSPSETLTKPCSPQDPVKEEEDLEDDTKPVHKWRSCPYFMQSISDKTLYLRLLIKSAILMPTAKKDDIIVVQIESEGYNKEKVSRA